MSATLAHSQLFNMSLTFQKNNLTSNDFAHHPVSSLKKAFLIMNAVPSTPRRPLGFVGHWLPMPSFVDRTRIMHRARITRLTLASASVDAYLPWPGALRIAKRQAGDSSRNLELQNTPRVHLTLQYFPCSFHKQCDCARPDTTWRF